MLSCLRAVMPAPTGLRPRGDVLSSTFAQRPRDPDHVV